MSDASTNLAPTSGFAVVPPVRLHPDVCLRTLIACKLKVHLAAETLGISATELLAQLPKDANARIAVEEAAKFYGLLQTFDIVRDLLDGLVSVLDGADAVDYVKGLSAATTALGQFMTAAKEVAGSSAPTVTVNIVDKILADIQPEYRATAMTLFRPPKPKGDDES